MSPLWRNRLYISLKPDEVAAICLAKGLRPRVAAKTLIRCAGGGDAPWRSALTLLADLLGKPEWQRTDARIVLSNSFARFQMMPANAQVTDDEERQAFAMHKLASVYGDSSDWEIRIAEGEGGANSLVCGVDRALLEGIDACCRLNRVRLRSVQPYLMAAYNRARRELTEDAVWFAVTERERVCALSLQNGALRSIHNRSIAADDHFTALMTALEREKNLAGIGDQPEKIMLYGPGIAPGAVPAAMQSSIRLVGLAPRFELDWKTDAGFAMAASV